MIVRNIAGEQFSFQLDEATGNVRGEFIAERSNISIYIPRNSIYYGRERANEIDWECVDAFMEYYIKHREIIEVGAQKRLARLIRQIGWWRAEELEIGIFRLLAITPIKIRTKLFLGESHKFKDQFIFEMDYAFHGPDNKYWLDTYGSWSVVFKNDRCLSAIREQI